MFKINLINSFVYLLIKYIIFFLILAFIGDRFKHVVIDNAETSSEMFKLTLGYIVYILIFAIPMILVFGFPLYYILKIKKWWSFIVCIIIFYCVEYFVYTFLNSQKYFYDWNGIYNALIGIILLGIFFHKTIRSKFTES